jgi:ATP-dependent DNA helicase DinG
VKRRLAVAGGAALAVVPPAGLEVVKSPDVNPVHVASVFGMGGPLAVEVGVGYEPRPAQVELSEAIERTMAHGGRLLAEAPTGSGKSFAGVVPAAVAAVARRERTIYVTANIALQEQVVGKDLPLVARVIPGFKFALAKGMGNYLCRLAHESAGAMLAPGWTELCDWVESTTTGDLSELPVELDPAVRAAVTCAAEECAGHKCPRADGCFALDAKAAYRAADVVVTNYSLFFIDLAIRATGAPGILGDYSHVILDEAHKVPDIARDHFGWEVGHFAVMRTARGLGSDTRKALEVASDAFFKPLLVYAQSKAYSGRIKRAGELPALAVEKLAGALRVVATEQQSEAEELKGIAKARAMQAAARARMIAQQLQSATRPDLDTASAFYLEVERERVKVGAKPIDIGPILRAHLYDNASIKSVTAMSATLATGAGSFGFILGELGFEGAETLELATPFDFTRATLVTPRMVDPREPTFHDEVAAKVVEIVKAAKGRTLALFTSYRSLDIAHRALLAAGLPYRILRQGEAPRTRLIEMFRDDQSSVLLGTESMWAGVDVPGESCACVVIDRLPFPSPADPIMNAITERDPEGWFFTASIPRAIVAFRQGFGRLIRRQTDRGVVVCLDSRITTKSYGSKFVRSLPRGVRIANHLRVIGEVLS